MRKLKGHLFWVMVLLLAMNSSLSAKEELKFGKTELYCDIPSHALAFDSKGNLYIAKGGRDIYKITPDRKAVQIANLDVYSEKTHIWSMEVGKDGSIYCAAQDRVLKIGSDGKVSTHIQEDFSGPCGVTDIEFDANGNLYAAYDDIVARYTPALQKKVVIEGRTQAPVMIWIVGVTIDLDYKNLYVTDLRGQKVVKYSIDPGGTVNKVSVTELYRFPEYFAVHKTGDVYVSLPEDNCIMRIQKNGSFHRLECEGKLVFPTTLSFGNLEENWLYIACRNGIYRTYIAAE